MAWTGLEKNSKDTEAADYAILDLRTAAPTDAGPVSFPELLRLAAHASGSTDTGSVLAALRRGGNERVALDVTPEPGQDGFDSGAVHHWISDGGSVVISPGGTDPLDERRLEIAAGLARRAWTGPERVLNAHQVGDILQTSRSREKKPRRTKGEV
jgi:hypothetical protein